MGIIEVVCVSLLVQISICSNTFGQVEYNRENRPRIAKFNLKCEN